MKLMQTTAGRRFFFALSTIALVAAAFVGATPAFAQTAPKNPVAISLTAQKVTKDAEGKEQLKPADRAMPGEVVQYDALYKNTSSTGVKNLAPTLPIPAGMTYLPDTARPAPAQASLDGKIFAALPLKRKVTAPDGTIVEQEVPASEFRALRWNLGDLAAGGKATVTARARLAQR